MTEPSPGGTRHFFTVDVEEHFQVSAFEGVVHRDDWDRHEGRVERNVNVLLELLARHSVAGTFFVLGWVGERYPELVRRIAAAGHEVASHGHDHRRVTRQTAEQFRASVKRAKAVLEDASGAQVVGFRAPSFSIVPGLEWAFDVLLEEGHVYDSSLFPVKRPGGYGYPNAPRDPFWIERPSGWLYELPLTTVRRFGVNLPAAGGAYLRVFPFGLVRSAFADCDLRKVPGVFYVHPWEVDPAQPRIRASVTARLRHYTGLDRTVGRIERLLTEFRFGSIAAHVRELAVTNSV